MDLILIINLQLFALSTDRLLFTAVFFFSFSLQGVHKLHKTIHPVFMCFLKTEFYPIFIKDKLIFSDCVENLRHYL